MEVPKMPYEIPQKLQYEEKIIFNLTFKQLIWALLLILPALLIFLKSNLTFYLRLLISVQLVGVALLFMFFNLTSYIKNLVLWLRFLNVWILEEKMIQFLGIEKIENGAVYVWKTKKPVKKRKK